MNISLVGAAVVALGIFAALPTQAQSQPSGQASVTVTAPHQSYTPGAGEFRDFANTYVLGNGQVVQFAQRGNHYYVQLKSAYRPLHREDRTGQQFVATRLRPVGPGAFVTDSGATLTFGDGGEEVAITGFERLPEARVAAGQANVLVVARR